MNPQKLVEGIRAARMNPAKILQFKQTHKMATPVSGEDKMLIRRACRKLYPTLKMVMPDKMDMEMFSTSMINVFALYRDKERERAREQFQSILSGKPSK